MVRLLVLITVSLVFIPCCCFCEQQNGKGNTAVQALEEVFSQEVVVDLREPIYSDGVITTTKGGIITGSDIRIQAINLKYTRKIIDDKPVFRVEASGNLMVEYSSHVLIGDSMEFDFQSRSGVIHNGRSGIEPWYFGGKEFRLMPDGSYIIVDGFVTTSESYNTDWQIHASKIRIVKNNFLNAKNVQFRLVRLPVFWMPSYKANLKKIIRAPIKFRGRWGGKRGTRLGVSYQIYTWRQWKALLLLDYNFQRGLGGGIETRYLSDDEIQQFFTRNYYASDNSISDPNKKRRYRFSGLFSNRYYHDKIFAELTYDKVSDEDMPSDYRNSGIHDRYLERSQLHIRRQEPGWIWNLLARVRLNQFKTVKQEAPTFSQSWRPQEIGKTGVISDIRLNLSNLEFKYSSDLPGLTNYHSPRLEWQSRFYRPWRLGCFNVTPQAGFVGIYYANNANKTNEFVPIGIFGGEINTHLYRHYGTCKHGIRPYARYLYYHSPSTPIVDHYIFDLQDDWHKLNMLRGGIINSLYKKDQNGEVLPYLVADCYANAFFGNSNIPRTVPRLHAEVLWHPYSTLRYTIDAAWDLEHAKMHHINFRTLWTYNQDFALTAEFRHRNAYAWRKVDHHNYNLDAFYPESILKSSMVSDQRNTLITNIYYQLLVNWGVQLYSRHGWNRVGEPNYHEYQMDLLTILRSSWHVRFSYQHREDDHRFVIHLSLGKKRLGLNPPAPFPISEGNY